MENIPEAPGYLQNHCQPPPVHMVGWEISGKRSQECPGSMRGWSSRLPGPGEEGMLAEQVPTLTPHREHRALKMQKYSKFHKAIKGSDSRA